MTIEDSALSRIPPAMPSHPLDHKRMWSQVLANNVKHFRRSKNISQESLANECGIYRTYLSRIETGSCNPSLSVLIALATALEILPHILFEPME